MNLDELNLLFRERPGPGFMVLAEFSASVVAARAVTSAPAGRQTGGLPSCPPVLICGRHLLAARAVRQSFVVPCRRHGSPGAGVPRPRATPGGAGGAGAPQTTAPHAQPQLPVQRVE